MDVSNILNADFPSILSSWAEPPLREREAAAESKDPLRRGSAHGKSGEFFPPLRLLGPLKKVGNASSDVEERRFKRRATPPQRM